MTDELSSLITIKSIVILDDEKIAKVSGVVSLDFEVKQFENLILNKDCSYINQSTSAVEFYQCPCTEGFSLICKACADKCHKDHNPYKCGFGNNECKCGKGNHVIPSFEKEQKSPCIYNTFFDIIPNQMYNRYLDKSVEPYQKVTLCLVCKEGCNSKEQINEGNEKIKSLSESINQEVENKKNCCECKDHHEFNPIQINGRFLHNKELQGHMLNFNVNIMFKIQDSKKNYIEELTKKLDEYFQNKSDLGNYDFFDDWMNYNAFEMFSLFFQNWKTKYTTMVPFLEKYKREDLLNLLSTPKELTNRLKLGNIEQNILSGKLFYAELLFNYFIKSTFVKSNNLFSLKTILNMPLEQRFHFLHKATDFYKYKSIRQNSQFEKERKNEENDWMFIQTLCNEIIDSFDSIVEDSGQVSWEVLDKAFITFNRIMKYIIKYNIISEEQKEKYVTIVNKTLLLFLKLKGVSLANTSLSIMKSLIYLIIYRNDRLCFENLKIFNRKEKEKENKFIFEYSDFNMQISKIFLLTIGHKNNQGNVKEILQFDYCVKKLNEMMLFTQDSYFYSICKSNIFPNDILHSCCFNITTNRIKEINPEIFDMVSNFVQKLNNENQCYFLYAQSLELYLTHVNNILFNFGQTYRTLNNDQLIPEENEYTQILDKPSNFQKNFFESTLILPFYQKLDELIHIYANGKFFRTEARLISLQVDLTIEKEFTFLLETVLPSLLDQDNQNNSIVTILMNIKPNIFIQTFTICKLKILFNYLNKLADICISRINYQSYDSFYFFTGCLLELLKNYSNDLIYLPEIMKLSSKILRKAFIKEESFLTIVEVFSVVFQNLSLLENLRYFFTDLTKKIDSDKKESISNFYEAYFMFLSDLIENDCLFYGYIKNEIVDVDKIYTKVLEENTLKPMLSVQIMRYYLLKNLSFNFKMTNSTKQLEIMFPTKSSPEDLNLDFIKIWPKALVVGKGSKHELFIQQIITCSDFNTKFIDKIMAKDIRVTPQNIFEWYEHVVVRPYYKLLSLSTLDLKALSGRYINNIYDIVLSFFDITKKIYSISRKIPKDLSVSVKTELNENERDQLNMERETTFKTIKFYEIEKLISFFVFILKIIIKPKNKDDNEGDPLKTLFQDSANIETQLYLLAKKYLHTKQSTSDDDLVLIKTISSLISETDLHIREKIVSYFLFKLFCQMTDISTKVYEVKLFSIEETKLQNNYGLLFLNKYFSHDSKQFQLAFENFFTVNESNDDDDNPFAVENKKILLSYLSLNLIFPSILLETEKLYSIDMLKGDTISRNITFTFKIGKYAMKFIQNLCEKYNKLNKTLFFSSYFELRDKEKLTENSEKKFELKQQDDDDDCSYRPRSFFNFLSCNIRIINHNLFHGFKMQRNNFSNMISVGKNLQNIHMLYQGLSDLIIEMIQGTDSTNFDYIYFEEEQRPSNDLLYLFKNQLGDNFAQSKIVVIEKYKKEMAKYESEVKSREKMKSEQLIQTPPLIEPKKIEILFQFIIAIIETRDNLYDKEDLFNPNTRQNKKKIFEIIQNIITQDSVPKGFIDVLLKIYDMKELIKIVITLLKGLYVKWERKIDYESSNFNEEIDKVNLDHNLVSTLTNTYQFEEDIFNDELFKLASQIYLFILVISEKYERIEAKEIIELKTKLKEDLLKSEGSNGMFSFITNWFDSKKRKNNAKEEQEKLLKNLDDITYSCLFMSNIIKHCEFRVDGRSAILYFVIHPHSFKISQNSIDSFVETVDRHSSTTKLNGLVGKIRSFMFEIEKSIGQSLDYKEATFFNFYISLFINVALLIFLNGIGDQRTFLNYIIAIAIDFQLIINLLIILFFLVTKYQYYLDIAKNKHSISPSFSIMNYLNIYFFESFLFNGEIFFVNYVFLMGVLAICIRKYKLFFYVLQLLIVLDFVDTIKEIFSAFKLRFNQLFCMIAFLVILLYFYSNIGFYFYINEFNTVIDNAPQNICQTMVECIMTYFNHGVRAGGGIGDVLGDKSFSEPGVYYLRFTTDLIFYITVILLLLNMINGVIVSTFSQIRESSTAKQDDINDICFICNVKRKSFEKRKLDFIKHKKDEHKLRTYIYFFVTLLKKNEKDLDETEFKILDCINHKQNKCFPVKQTIYVEDLEENE